MSDTLLARSERDSETLGIFTEGIEPRVRRKSYGLAINYKGGGCE